MHRLFLGVGFWIGGLAVVAGAFGTHLLEGTVPDQRIQVFETAARYHFLHALAFIALALASARWPARAWSGAGLLMLLGLTIFCGSLYALALTGIGAFGAIAPVGGLLLIISWAWAGWISLTKT